MENQKLLKTIGKNLTIIRIIRGVTQKELAEKTNYNSQTISTIERGVQNSSIEVLNNISNALNIPIKSLFTTSSNWTKIIDDFENSK